MVMTRLLFYQMSCDGANPSMVMLILGISLLQPDSANLRHLFEENLARSEREYGMTDARTAGAARDLGLFLRGENDPAGAYRALHEAVDIDDKALGAEDKQTLADISALATVAPPFEAESLWRRAADGEDPAISSKAFAALGELRERAGDRAGAAAMYTRGVEKEEAASGRDSAETAVRLNSLALVSDPRRAIPLLERAVAIDRKRWGEKHPETATTESNLSGELLALGRVAESVRIGTQALSNFEATLGPQHPRTAAAASNLADAKRAAGDRLAAERLYRRALRIDEQALGATNPETLNDVKNLADFLSETGRHAEARALEHRFASNSTPR
jgi:tetratricopeptide (TPR) repeat protein